MLKEKYPYYLANQPHYDEKNVLAVVDKYSGKKAAEVSLDTPEVIDHAIAEKR